MVLGGAQGLGVLAQQHGLVDRVAVVGGEGHDVVHSGGGVQLVAQRTVIGHAGDESFDRRNRHGGTNNHAHL